MSRPSSTVMDHLISPRNAGDMQSPDGISKASLEGRAPYVTFFVRVNGELLKQVMFKTFGCGYSIATCSALTELAIESSLDDALELSSERLLEVLDGVPPEKEFCADMAIEALRAAITEASSKPLCSLPED